ncbi:tRNA-dihydrouridine synthase [Aeromonas salmonicida]
MSIWRTPRRSFQGANELAVHARTKREGYKAPAHWEYVDAIRRALPSPSPPTADLGSSASVSGSMLMVRARRHLPAQSWPT